MTRMRDRWSRRLAAVAVAGSIAGCGPGPEVGNGPRSVAVPAAAVTVAAASDLQTVLPAVLDGFRAGAPGAEVEATYDSTGRLTEQIKAGAPYDLFLAANMKFLNDLVAAGAVDAATVRPYAVGSLVLAVHAEAGVKVESLNDLTRPEVKKVAIANPATAPYGTAAKQALTRAGLWDALQPKIVIADSVRQAFQFVETGNAEAGLVGRATATGPGVRVVAVDPALHDPIVQGLGVVSDSKRKREAERFAAYLLGAGGQAALARSGFGPPPSAPAAAARP